MYVIDCCFVKQRAYNPAIGLESLLVAPASKVGGWVYWSTHADEFSPPAC